jgi:hypothetical protein
MCEITKQGAFFRGELIWRKILEEWYLL